MPCLNPDGTFAPVARAILEALDKTPLDEAGLAETTNLPLWRIRASLRELAEAGIIDQVQEGPVSLTDLGREALEIDRTC